MEKKRVRKKVLSYNNMEEFTKEAINIYKEIKLIDELLMDSRYTCKEYRKPLMQKRDNLFRKLNNLRPKNNKNEFVSGKEVNKNLNIKKKN